VEDLDFELEEAEEDAPEPSIASHMEAMREDLADMVFTLLPPAARRSGRWTGVSWVFDDTSERKESKLPADERKPPLPPPMPTNRFLEPPPASAENYDVTHSR
jgi:hypothetical protein